MFSITDSDIEDDPINNALTSMRLVLIKLRIGFELNEETPKTDMFNLYMMNTIGMSRADLSSVYKTRNLINITGLNMEMDLFDILKKYEISSKIIVRIFRRFESFKLMVMIVKVF